MKSMTGFGSAEASSESGLVFSLEISSVNKKQLEIRVLLPKEIMFYEIHVRQVVGRKISRGMVTVRLNVRFEGRALTETVRINEPVIMSYIRKIHKLRERMDIPEGLNLVELLKLPGAAETVYPELSMEDEAMLEEIVEKAIDGLDGMRINEGEAIRADLLKRIGFMEAELAKLEPIAEKIPHMHRSMLLKRLQDSGLSVGSDDDRVMKEFVIYSDKSDISEELTRLKSHFVQFRCFLDKNHAPVGRSLDFLVQEIFREINTIGNKALLAEVTPIIVSTKTEIEKIREQVQNIE